MKCLYDVTEVRRAAHGRWDHVFAQLAPSLAQAMNRPGKHCACPVHGGKDAFRLFANYEDNGACVCNTCGQQRDGFATLCWLNRWSFRQSLEQVGRLLIPERSCDARVELPLEIFRGLFIRCGWSVTPGSGKKTFQVTLSCDKGHTLNLASTHLAEIFTEQAIRHGDEIELLRYSNNVWQVHVLATREELQKRNAEQAAIDQKRRAVIETTWANALPLNSSDPRQFPVLKYLSSRKVLVESNMFLTDIRFAEDVPCWNGQGWERYPVMIAAVRDSTGTLVTLHKTFLTNQGKKAGIATPKRLCALPSYSTIAGCTIRLGHPGRILGVAEGIETALSVCAALNIPCWSCISAAGLETMVPPVGTEMILIFADKDRSLRGQQAAENLNTSLRVQGIASRIVTIPHPIPPGVKGIDWNDIWRSGGASEFPTLSSLMESNDSAVSNAEANQKKA